jgi:hypothetical protein
MGPIERHAMLRNRTRPASCVGRAAPVAESGSFVLDRLEIGRECQEVAPTHPDRAGTSPSLRSQARMLCTSETYRSVKRHTSGTVRTEPERVLSLRDVDRAGSTTTACSARPVRHSTGSRFPWHGRSDDMFEAAPCPRLVVPGSRCPASEPAIAGASVRRSTRLPHELPSLDVAGGSAVAQSSRTRLANSMPRGAITFGPERHPRSVCIGYGPATLRLVV